MPRARFNLAKNFDGLKSDYSGMTPNRFRRERYRLYGSADSHYANEIAFIRMREYVRDMDRNDSILGQLVDRAVENQIQNGFLLKPNTGDRRLDRDLKDRWDEWANDAQQCDTAGEMTFAAQESLSCRAEFVDGDIFALPIEDGSLQWIEADRCRTPARTQRNVVHGVLLGEQRQRLEYWFTKDNLNPYDRVFRVADMDRVAARDEQGNPQVFHLYGPSRVSQTRGVTAFKAIFDLCGMVEDTNFAALVKQQMAACLVWFLERTDTYAADVQIGERQRDALDDATSAITEGISPGQFIRGKKGEKLTAQSPNIPSSEFFQHMRFLLQVIGVNIGMPLVLVLLDGKESNFSGARVALDQARQGFRCRQFRRIARFHSPVYRWKVGEWMQGDPALRSAAGKSGLRIFGHKWNPPSWPYLQPLHDAQADAIRLENLLASPRQIAADNGLDYAEILRETVEDNGAAILACIKMAQKIEQRTGVPIHWRDVYNRAFPRGAKFTDDFGSDPAEGDGKTLSSPNANAAA